jgi:dUTP pyrophosphatase
VEVALLILDDSVTEPTYATDDSVGFDISTAETVEIDAGAVATVRTGLVIATPPGWSLFVSLRSSTPNKYGVIQPHGVGIVDQDYCGPQDEIHLQPMNVSGLSAVIPAGSRIAQGIFVRVTQTEWTRCYEPGAESRGGFGSTD